MTEFEWDESKNAVNQKKHGISFAVVVDLFVAGKYVVIPSDRYDEERFKAVGIYAGEILTVVFTYRNATIRLISARRASREERKEYSALCAR